MVLKTPHTVTLFYSATQEPVYDPITDEYIDSAGSQETVSALVNFITDEQQFKDYGTRTNRIAVVRFLQPKNNFQYLIFNNRIFKPIEQNDLPKQSFRVQEVD